MIRDMYSDYEKVTEFSIKLKEVKDIIKDTKFQKIH